MCLTLCLGFGSEKGSVYLVGMLRETRGVVVYGGVVLVGRVVLNGEGVWTNRWGGWPQRQTQGVVEVGVVQPWDEGVVGAPTKKGSSDRSPETQPEGTSVVSKEGNPESVWQAGRRFQGAKGGAFTGLEEKGGAH